MVLTPRASRISLPPLSLTPASASTGASRISSRLLSWYALSSTLCRSAVTATFSPTIVDSGPYGRAAYLIIFGRSRAVGCVRQTSGNYRSEARMPATEVELLDAEHRLQQAQRDGDVAALDGLLDDRLIAIG